MSLNRKAILSATVMLCSAAPVLAQNAIELDPIRIETEEAQAALGNTEITTEEIEERNPTTLADVFTGTPEGLGKLNSAAAEEKLNRIGGYVQMRENVSYTSSVSSGAQVDAQKFTLVDGPNFDDSGRGFFPCPA